MVVVTFSGVPRVGGRVMGGRTAWIFAVTKVSLTREVRMELFPTLSSPQMHIRTGLSLAAFILCTCELHTGGHGPCYER